MTIRVTQTSLDGVVIVETECFGDERGFLIESYHKRKFTEAGVSAEFVQDNHSRSACGVLRGIHFQDDTAPMVKLVRCTAGRILDVAVDLRVGSPTFARWAAVELSAENRRQMFVPVGFGHAFLTLTDAEVHYKCSNYYTPSAERSLAWNDPGLGIEWPTSSPILSPRDRQAMSLAGYLQDPAFTYPGV
jgi:dTDP-4-dehydrorhamnose 3,5-epimerase